MTRKYKQTDHKLRFNFELTDFGVPMYKCKNKTIGEAMQELRIILTKKLGTG